MDGQPHESQRPSQATSDSVVGHGESIAKHPLSGEPDFAELRRKVQFCKLRSERVGNGEQRLGESHASDSSGSNSGTVE